jgi:uncharacterized protein (DUF1800 family)
MQERDYIHGFRFGFGATTNFDARQELEIQHSKDNAAQALSDRFAQFVEVSQKVKDSKRDPMIVEEERALSAVFQQRDVHEAIVQAVNSKHMFTERLSLFWSNHFCLGLGNATVSRLAGPYVAVLRQNMFGRFRDLLAAAVLSPPMMSYLNLQQAIGPNSPAGTKSKKGLNENLGREILELHSLGVEGGYTQQDVGALSRLLTGWRFDPVTGEVGFVLRRAEPGSKTLLGQVIGGQTASAQDLNVAFDVLSKHPATAKFIAKKLVLHFFGPGFSDVSAEIAQVFTQTDGDLKQVYASLLEASNKLEKNSSQFRNDAVFLIAALRALPLRENILKFELRDNGRPKSNPATAGAFVQLRQKFWLAPSPAGWPDMPDYWSSPSVMTARLRHIPRLVRFANAIEPVAWAEQVLGPYLRPATRKVLELAPNRLQGMGLVLASPEFNRR